MDLLRKEADDVSILDHATFIDWRQILASEAVFWIIAGGLTTVQYIYVNLRHLKRWKTMPIGGP